MWNKYLEREDSKVVGEYSLICVTGWQTCWGFFGGGWRRSCVKMASVWLSICCPCQICLSDSWRAHWLAMNVASAPRCLIHSGTCLSPSPRFVWDYVIDSCSDLINLCHCTVFGMKVLLQYDFMILTASLVSYTEKLWRGDFDRLHQTFHQRGRAWWRWETSKSVCVFMVVCLHMGSYVCMYFST